MSDNDDLIKIWNMPRQPVTLERIREMLLFAARLVDERGMVMQPILDRLEREYRAATQRGFETRRVLELIQHG